MQDFPGEDAYSFMVFRSHLPSAKVCGICNRFLAGTLDCSDENV